MTNSSLPSRLVWPSLVLLSLALTSWGCGDDPPSSPPPEQPEPDADVQEDVANDVVADLSTDAPDRGDDVRLDAPDPNDADATADSLPDLTDLGEVIPFVPNDIPQDDETFPLGVQAGAMRPNSVLLWTFTSDRATKQLRVWRQTDEPEQVRLYYEARVVPSEAGYIHATVEGLRPGTIYRYAFFAGSEEAGFTTRSDIGRVRTALSPGSLEPIVVGASSCTSDNYAPWEALEDLAGEPLDLFLHAGDMSYNDGSDSIDEYREVWHETLSDPGYRAIYSSIGLYATWDDHEVSNNWNPETIDPDQFAAAHQAFFETLALEQGPNGELWRSYSWGDTAEFFVLDSRSERRPSTRETDEAEYLSTAQLEWLMDGLSTSTAHFKVVLNSVPITQMPLVWQVMPGDRWDGYAAQRRALLDHITDNAIRNVWFVSGDFHIGFVSRVEPDGPASAIYEIAAGPGGNGPNPLFITMTGDQFPFVTGRIEVGTTLRFDPEEDSVHVRFVHQDGDVLFDETLSQSE